MIGDRDDPAPRWWEWAIIIACVIAVAAAPVRPGSRTRVCH
jgi:hypothetical protein